MTVWELIQQLSQAEPYSQVVIQVDGKSFGSTPAVAINDRIINGFDWDNGKIILVPSHPLAKARGK